MTLGTKFVTGRNIKKGLPILQQISLINITSNETTVEVYKSIRLALIANPQVNIMVEDPSELPYGEHLNNVETDVVTKSNKS